MSLGGSIGLPILAFQPIPTIVTVAPNINQWYESLRIDNGAGMLHQYFPGVRVANETLEWELTVDGQLLGILAEPIVFDNDYQGIIFGSVPAQEARTDIVGASSQIRKLDVPFRTSLLIRLRKTTAAGAGSLIATTTFSRYRV